ncbi:ABC transporter permease [Occultella aeris]|uniref:Glutathione transport system permease protein GsiC n=1 Tax=Occultella aeris TaxID=2761496 RepID=A0A7M4DPL9_9MICO|nr:ABC transporter permease [Occultella aeris]VZO39413.1 Glutathione transport system permease protein GsiC [Occultella aeris]
MGFYLVRRLGQAAVVLWAAFTVSFVILYMLPGDPVAIMLNPGGQATYVDPEAEAALRAELGFDKPLIEQYFTRLVAAVQGDFGTSIRTGEPVLNSLGGALPETLKLAGASLLLAITLGMTLALTATFMRARWLREALLPPPPLAISLPGFWVGLMLLQVFSFGLGWFPALGNDGVASLVLPAITLGVPAGAVGAQVLANSLGAVSRQPFGEAARAKGVSRLRTHLVHVLRNAAIPSLTIVGLIVGSSLAGAVVVEAV